MKVRIRIQPVTPEWSAADRFPLRFSGRTVPGTRRSDVLRLAARLI